MRKILWLTEEERSICVETLARVQGDPDIMRAEQRVVNVAMGLWTEPTQEGRDRQEVRLDAACAAYHALLSQAKAAR